MVQVEFPVVLIATHPSSSSIIILFEGVLHQANQRSSSPVTKEHSGTAVRCSALSVLLLQCNDSFKECFSLRVIYLDTWHLDKLVDRPPFEL